MLSIKEIPLFLNEKFIDELWVRLKQEGLTIERVQEASQKINAKASVGTLGKLWNSILPDIQIGLGGEVAGRSSEKLEINSMLRSLLLPELISDLVEIPNSAMENSNRLSQGAFARIVCDNLALAPIPTFAAWARQLMLSNMHETELAADTPQIDLLKIIDSVFSGNRAMTLSIRTSEDATSSAAMRMLMNSEMTEVHNALAVCNDDMILVASLLDLYGVETVVFSVLEEAFVNRSLAAFTGDRPVSFFGQVAYLKIGASHSPNVVGMRAAAITLC